MGGFQPPKKLPWGGGVCEYLGLHVPVAVYHKKVHCIVLYNISWKAIISCPISEVRKRNLQL